MPAYNNYKNDSRSGYEVFTQTNDRIYFFFSGSGNIAGCDHIQHAVVSIFDRGTINSGILLYLLLKPLLCNALCLKKDIKKARSVEQAFNILLKIKIKLFLLNRILSNWYIHAFS